MAKASAPGRTKTRLVPPLNGTEAAALNTSFLQDVADNILEAATTIPVSGYMAFGPPGAQDFFRAILPPGIGLIESWIGAFGECLFHAATELFARGHTAACLLNSDSPTLPNSLIVELVAALSEPGDRAVLGPSEDGGYYVLGLKAPHRRMFEDIAWSTERVAEQTLDRAREIGLPIHVLPVWYDVDDARSLERLHRELFHDASFGSDLTPFDATHTREILQASAPSRVCARHSLSWSGPRGLSHDERELKQDALGVRRPVPVLDGARRLFPVQLRAPVRDRRHDGARPPVRRSRLVGDPPGRGPGALFRTSPHPGRCIHSRPVRSCCPSARSRRTSTAMSGTGASRRPASTRTSTCRRTQRSLLCGTPTFIR